MDGAVAVALAVVVLAPGVAGGQRSRGGPEFTKQGLLVSPFGTLAGTDPELGTRISETLRSRLDGLLPGREVELLRNDSVRVELERAGHTPVTLRRLSRTMRDTFVAGQLAGSRAGPGR